MKKGDTVRTPRFLTVTIKEVYESREDATRDGFTEPTHYVVVKLFCNTCG